ncbi:MAG TPA: MFS transporter, partial [Thermoanaerobaculia bacterium]
RLGTGRALLLFASLTAVGFLVYLVWRSIPGVFAGLFLVMAWKSFGLPATFALVGEELSGSQRIVGFTVQSILRRLPIVIAPPLGGLLIERLGMAEGMRTGFAISIVLAAAMLYGLRSAFRSQRSARTSPLVPAFSSEKRRKASLDPTLKRLLFADILIRLCEGLPDVFLVVWAIEILRLTPSQFGLATSILMTTAILSYFPAAALARHVEKKPFVLLTFLFFTLFPLAVVLSRSFVHLLAAYIVGGLREVGEPARKALIVDLAAREARGRTVGLYYSIRGFAVAGAAAVGGALWTIRPSLTFYAAAGLGVLGTAFAAFTLPSRSNVVAPEAAR